MFPARSWRQELADKEPRRGISSSLPAKDLAAYTSSRKLAGSDSPQRLGRRLDSTTMTMQKIDDTCERLAAVREMIRGFPQSQQPQPPPPPPPDVDYTNHDEWLQFYATAPRGEHPDHGPWVGSPKSRSPTTKRSESFSW